MKLRYYTAARRKIDFHTVPFCAGLEHWLARGGVYTVLLAMAAAVMRDFFPSIHSGVIRIPLITLVAAFQYNALIFCNGWMLALFFHYNQHWKLVFGSCFVYTFGSTVYTVYVLLQPWFFECWWPCGTAALWLIRLWPVVGYTRPGIRAGGWRMGISSFWVG
jgi:hypothetical protein